MAGSRLFAPLKIGDISINHRMVMAPLTRLRATDDFVPQPFVKDYYSQRASVPGTLIISEGTTPARRAGVFPNMPGIWSREQIEAWKEITEAVHSKGSYIFLQIAGFGRTASAEIEAAAGFEVLAPSAIPMDANSHVPREMTIAEIEDAIQYFVQGARNAIEAGFDGVELHGANGYLVNQFMSTKSNQRTDRYGGSIENRSRFPLELAKACVEAIGADKIGFRLSPWSEFQGVKMEEGTIPQFTHLIENLKTLKLAYLHLVESRVSGANDAEGNTANESLDFAVEAWANTSPILLAGGYSPDGAKAAVDKEYKDKDVAIVFGRHFISTPDLPFRVQKRLPLNPYNRATFYSKDTEGYTTYPFSDEFEREFAAGAAAA